MFEAIFAIVGTILGFLLSEWAQSRREEREEMRLAKNVRTLISLEIDANLQRLKSFWEEVCDSSELRPIKGLSPTEDIGKTQLARCIVRLPFPNFSRVALDSQLPQLPRALDDPLIPKVLRVYDLVDRVQVLRQTLEAAAREQKTDWASASRGEASVSLPAALSLSRAFDSIAPAVWDEFEDIVNQVASEGNPLRSRDT